MKQSFPLATLLMVLSCFAVAAQVPQKKADLNLSDREQWRKILRWPDSCEAGFQADRQYSPPGGVNFDKLGPREYLVSVGCGNEWLFIYYRERTPVVVRLLRFAEYDAAHGVSASTFSKVHSVAQSFDARHTLWIYSQTSPNVCLTHRYRINHGQPSLIGSRKIPCADVINTSRAPL